MDEFGYEEKKNENQKFENLNRNETEQVFSKNRLNLQYQGKDNALHETEFDATKEGFDYDKHKRDAAMSSRNADNLEKQLKEETIGDPMSFQRRRMKQEQLFADRVSELEHDYKWYGHKDSPNMVRVKTSLRAVINAMSLKVSKSEGNKPNVVEISKQVTAIYNEAMAACKNYEQNTPAKHSTGKKRLAMVENLHRMLRTESDNLKTIVDCAARGVFDDKNIETVSDLFWNFETTEIIGEAKWQKEGNSTDVYRIVSTEKDSEGKNKVYYVKENLHLLSDDFDGFLDRRILQVSDSQKHRAENLKALKANKNLGLDEKNKGEEQRLVDGNLDDKDYEIGLEILKLMKNKIDAEDGKDKYVVRDRMLAFLGHDFDKFFKDYTTHEAYNKRLMRTGSEGIQALIDELSVSEDAKQSNRLLIEKYQKALALFDRNKFKPMTQYEYLMMRIKENTFAGLDAKKDSDILGLLKKLCSKNKPEGIKTFFTRTLGKEVELYGQQVERGGVGENEVLAANNVATGRLAEAFGFDDVVTSSKLQIVNFTLKGKSKPQDVSCTLIDEAPGKEMLQIVQEAKDNKKTLSYSPKAMRQLMRLQMFDTVCSQVDRHWRNFKCQVDTTSYPDKWVITSIKSYDHDQSFGTQDALEGQKKKENKKGMLPKLVADIDVNSPEYSYLISKKMAAPGPAFLKDALDPKMIWTRDCDLKKDSKEISMIKIINDKGIMYGDSYFLMDINKLHANKYGEIGLLMEEYCFGNPHLMETGLYAQKNKNNHQIDENAKQCKAADCLEYEDYSKIADESLTVSDEDSKYNGYQISGILYNLVTDMCKKDTEKEFERISLNTKAYHKDPKTGKVIRDKSQYVVDVFKQGEGATEKIFDVSKLTKEQLDLADAIVTIKKLTTDSRIDETGNKLGNNDFVRTKLVDKIEEPRTRKDKNEELYNQITKKELGQVMVSLKVIDNTLKNYSFSEPRFLNRLQWILYYFKLNYANDPQAAEALQEEEINQKLEQDEQNQPKNELANDKYIENKFFKIPTMLHMDKQAYEDLLKMEQDIDNGSVQIDFRLKDLNWDAKKLQSFKNKIKATVKEIKEISVRVSDYLVQTYGKDSPLSKFFLDEEDYDAIGDIKDIAWNPALSYLGIEDPNYLYGDSDFTENVNLTKEQVEQALAETNEQRTGQRQRLGEMKEYKSIVSSKIIKIDNEKPDDNIINTNSNQ